MEFLANWRTTLAGGGALLTALGTLATALSRRDYEAIGPLIPALISALGLIFAADGRNGNGNGN